MHVYSLNATLPHVIVILVHLNKCDLIWFERKALTVWLSFDKVNALKLLVLDSILL